jgi:hypothetical protein
MSLAYRTMFQPCTILGAFTCNPKGLHSRRWRPPKHKATGDYKELSRRKFLKNPPTPYLSSKSPLFSVLQLMHLKRYITNKGDISKYGKMVKSNFEKHKEITLNFRVTIIDK